MRLDPEDVEAFRGVVERIMPEHEIDPDSDIGAVHRIQRIRVTIRRIRLAMTAYASLLLLVAPIACFAPQIESRYFPVRTEQVISSVSRDDSTLCWDWTSYKARDKVSPNIDVFIDTPVEGAAVSSLYEAGTHMPWIRSLARSPFKKHVQRFCVLLPPYVTPTTPVTVRQIVYYPGLMGLWQIQLRVPDVVSIPSQASSP